MVVIINADLLAQLRSHCAKTRTSPTEVILTAHLELAEQLQDELKPTPADQRRIALGLPQAAASGRLGPGKPLSLWLSAVALADLDAAADAVGVTRAATSPHSSRRCSPARAPQRTLTRGPTLTRRRDAGWIPAPTPRNLATRRSRAAPTQLEDHRCRNETPQRTTRCGNN